MISGFFRSLQAYSKSIKYLSKPWVFKYLMLSGFISLLVFGILGGVVYVFGGDLGHNILDNFYEGDAPNWLRLLIGGFAKFVSPAAMFSLNPEIIPSAPGSVAPFTVWVGVLNCIEYHKEGRFKLKWGSFARIGFPFLVFFPLTAQLLEPVPSVG